MANRSKFISTQQTFSYSFQTSTFASFTQSNKKTQMMDAKILRKSITRKDLRPNQSLTGVFPSRSTPTSCNTLLRTGCKHTGQAHWGYNRNVIHGRPSSKVYSSWNNIDQFAKANQEGTSLNRAIASAINNPANIPRRWNEFLVSAAQLQ